MCPKCREDLEQYGIGSPPNQECTACGWDQLTSNMRYVLRKLLRRPEGVYLTDLDERTVNALVRRGLVRTKFVNVVTPTGRRMGVHEMVYLKDDEA